MTNAMMHWKKKQVRNICTLSFLILVLSDELRYRRCLSYMLTCSKLILKAQLFSFDTLISHHNRETWQCKDSLHVVGVLEQIVNIKQVMYTFQPLEQRLYTKDAFGAEKRSQCKKALNSHS